MTGFIHEQDGWPQFKWSAAAVAAPLAAVSRRQGRLIGRMEALGFALREEAVLRSLTEEVVTSSDIEGEVLDRGQVRSSLARRLGVDIGALAAVDRDVEGVVEMTLDATQRYADPLTVERLFGWHSALFPTGRSGLQRIAVSAWREDHDGPMRVVSGPIGRERIHFEAPAATRLPAEMDSFLRWFGEPPQTDPLLRAALAHMWFVTIHPFEDGNGRIARAVADMALARTEQTPQRFYSMSAQIRAERRAYYDQLEATQRGDLDVTAWLVWFLACLDRAFDRAETTLSTVFRKARFWDRYGAQVFNDRQRRILNALLDGFQGHLTSSKYAAIAKTSQDTAGRDLTDLVERGIFVRGPAGGRSTRYELADL